MGDRKWAGWLGGLAMVAICVVPFVLAELGPHHDMSLAVIGSKSAGLTFDYGFVLCSVPGVLAAALLAPLTGYSRWIALVFTVPVANLYFAWVIGRRAGTSRTSRRSEPDFRGSCASPHVESRGVPTVENRR